MILATKESKNISYEFSERLLELPNTDLRIFGKPDCKKGRRMGVALAREKSVKKAVRLAKKIAMGVKILG